MNTKGTNGTVQVSDEGVGSAGLALFNKLVRAATTENLSKLLDAYYAEMLDSDEERQEELINELFVLLFQTRDVLKGKGERDLFYNLLFLLYKKFPKTVLGLVKFIPQFGYWKDILRIVKLIDDRVAEGKYAREDYLELRNALVDLYTHELKSSAESKKPTLSGKWAPREGSMYDNIATEFAGKIFPEHNGTYRMMAYRKLITALTRVVEQQMSNRHFSDIKFEHVPSKAMHKYKKAFMKRPANDNDRIQCAENLSQFLKDCAMGKAHMKTKTLMPHEVTKEALNLVHTSRYGDEYDPNKISSTEMLRFLDVQWKGVVEKFVDDICKECKAKKEDVIDILQHSIALSDVSGSMSGTPMDVSIGMGLLIAEFCKAFPNCLITFSSTPGMFHVTGETLGDKCEQIAGMPWGGNTDFLAAFRLMLTKAKETSMPPADFPKIMFVFSDMQFDAAVGNGYSSNVNAQLRKEFSSNHEIVAKEFKDAGYEIPLIVYWNLRANTPGHETSADVVGTVMLSGYSPTLLKSVFSGQDLSKFDFTEFKKSISPLKVYENTVHSPNYEAIRAALKEMKETWLEELSHMAQ